MKPESSLPHLQQLASCPYPEQNLSTSCPHSSSRRSILILSYHLRLGLVNDLLPSNFLTKTLYAPLLYRIRATFRAHLSVFDISAPTFFICYINTIKCNHNSSVGIVTNVRAREKFEFWHDF